MGGIGAVIGMATGTGEVVERVVITFVWLRRWALGLVLMARVFRLLLEPPRPGSLAHGPDRLRYEPGSSPAAEWCSWGGKGGRLPRSPRAWGSTANYSAVGSRWRCPAQRSRGSAWSDPPGGPRWSWN